MWSEHFYLILACQTKGYEENKGLVKRHHPPFLVLLERMQEG
jgi:hypothetical protein